MRMLYRLYYFKLLQISGVQTWVSRHQDFCVDNSTGQARSIISDTHIAFAFLELSERIANAEQEARLRYEDSATLFVSFVKHFGVFLLDKAL
jgi:hypothetical protein